MKRQDRNYEDYEGDYLVISSEDDDCLRAIRERIAELPMAERRIMVMYIEAGTYSAVAKQLKCSVPTVSKKIRGIKKKIKLKIDSVCRDY